MEFKEQATASTSSIAKSGPNQPSDEFRVIWQNLSFKTGPKKWLNRTIDRVMGVPKLESAEEGRMILNQVSGHVRSRQLTAVMGPSGAGKSTLLHCLFQNRAKGTTGRILVDSKSSRRLKVCFIPQNDYLNEWLTVREDLIFVSKLKLAQVSKLLSSEGERSCSAIREYTSELQVDHDANTLSVAQLLGLTNCLDVPIKKISGGQKKRLSVARELMSKPDILILDEPTTGLDSLTCFKTVKLLRDLAHLSPHPIAVVATIHQPQIEVFNLFDKTYFISKRGRIIYEDAPKSAVSTFEKVGKVKMPRVKYNPASFLIEIASDTLDSDVNERLANHQKSTFNQEFGADFLNELAKVRARRTSFYSRVMKARPDENHQHLAETSALDERTKSVDFNFKNSYYISPKLRDCISSHSTSIRESIRHISILTHRSWLSVIRNPTFTRTRLLFHTIFPLMMLVVYGKHMGSPNNCPKLQFELEASKMSESLKENLVRKNIEEVRLGVENLSFFFILMYGSGINLISCTAPIYPLTMHMFKKERINGLYSSGPYFIGQTLAELPLEFIYPTISVVLSYHLTGQESSYLEWRMLALSLIMCLVCYSTYSFGLLVGAIFVNNVTLAVLVGQLMLLPLALVSGLLIRQQRMTLLIQKAAYLSPFKHGIGAILASRYGYNICNCEEDLLPENGLVEFSGMSPQVKHVLDYMFPKNETSSGITFTEMFENFGQRFIKSQTFALELKSCDDVKPFLMHIFKSDDSNLPYGVAWLIIIIFFYKLSAYWIMRTFPYRI